MPNPQLRPGLAIRLPGNDANRHLNNLLPALLSPDLPPSDVPILNTAKEEVVLTLVIEASDGLWLYSTLPSGYPDDRIDMINIPRNIFGPLPELREPSL